MRTLVAQALGTLLARHPQLTAQTLEEVDDGLLGALLERRVDVVVTASALDHHEVECLGTCAYADNFGVFAAADHPLSGGAEPVALPDLVDQGWVMPGPGATPRVQFEARFRAAGLPVPAVVVEIRLGRNDGRGGRAQPPAVLAARTAGDAALGHGHAG
jgi:DNA-binding transcriptional LysR family regulator